MSGVLTVAPNERGKVRVFALDMPPQQLRFLETEAGALADVLGVEAIDPGQAEVFDVADLDDLGLSGYLTEGLGVPAAGIAADRARLDALTGAVLVLRSRAFGGHAVTLTPAAGVTPIGIYHEEATDWQAAGRIETESVKPRAGAASSPREARDRARRIGAGIFAAFMALIALVVLFLVAL